VYISIIPALSQKIRKYGYIRSLEKRDITLTDTLGLGLTKHMSHTIGIMFGKLI